MQQVIDVLLYHVAPGKYTAKETTESVEVDSALPGAKLGLKVGEGGITLNDKVLISQYDIPAANGVIHVIDTVQLPPMPVTMRLALDGRFRALVTAIKAAGLAETLDMQLMDYTLFAPTDSAFAKLPTGALDELIANPQALKDILAGHVVTPTLTAADVIKQNGKELPTLLAGVTLPISVTDGTVMVKDAKVIEPDVDFAGGVIHVIDNVLIPEAVPAEASAADADVLGRADRHSDLSGAQRARSERANRGAVAGRVAGRRPGCGAGATEHRGPRPAGAVRVYAELRPGVDRPGRPVRHPGWDRAGQETDSS